MELRRIVVGLWDNRRVILYPEGGLELELNVPGVGWVLDNGDDDPGAELAALLSRDKAVVDSAAWRHAVV
jgi:hypothetical protein